MGQAYQDGGKWWVPWTGEIVPLGAEFQDEGKWNLSQFVGLRPANFPYRIPATQEQIDAALRAESPTSVTFTPEPGVCIGGPLPPQPGDWTLKSWGRTRQVFAAEGVEVWESEGKAGHRTSLHRHPGHRQEIAVVSGSLYVTEVGTSYGASASLFDAGVSTFAGDAHELRFDEDCRFIEVYTGTGSVMGTIERIYK